MLDLTVIHVRIDTEAVNDETGIEFSGYLRVSTEIKEQIS